MFQSHLFAMIDGVLMSFLWEIFFISVMVDKIIFREIFKASFDRLKISMLIFEV